MNDRALATVLLVFSLFFCSLLGLSAVVCGGFGAVQLTSSGSFGDLTPIFLFTLGLLWCGLLLVPSAWFAVRRLRGQEDQTGSFSRGWSAWLPHLLMLLVYPLVLLLGSFLAQNNQFAWWVLPVLQIYLISLVRPIYMNIRHLIFASPFYYLLLGAGVAWASGFPGSPNGEDSDYRRRRTIRN